MADAILLNHYPLPKKGTVDLRISQSFEIQITAEEARQKVDRWLLDEVSYMIGAGEPLLVVDSATVVWRVPAIFTAAHIGEVGTAGAVDVNVQTGAMDTSSDRKEEIIRGAQALAEKMPPYKPRKDMAETWLAKGLQVTNTKPQGNPLEIIATTG